MKLVRFCSLALCALSMIATARCDTIGLNALSLPAHPIGWCTRAQVATLAQAKSVGFDYVELALQDVLPLSDDDFARFVSALRDSGVPALSGYNPIPTSIKLVGREVDVTKQDEHLKRLLERAGQLKLRYIILNSAAAWKVPDGFARAEALAQLTDFCRRFADAAQPHGITVLIEPQRSRDTNLITTIAEALGIVEAVNRPEFQMMVDYSFLRIQKDDVSQLRKVGEHLKDVHIANPEANRTYPLRADESNYAEFFQLLREIRYGGGLSVHASTAAFATDAPRAIAFLRAMAANASADASKPRAPSAK